MKDRRLRKQRIRATPRRPDGGRFRLGGWLSGRDSYLWFGEEGDGGAFYGFLGGQQLYRLAKAIVRHFEAEKP